MNPTKLSLFNKITTTNSKRLATLSDLDLLCVSLSDTSEILLVSSTDLNDRELQNTLSTSTMMLRLDSIFERNTKFNLLRLIQNYSKLTTLVTGDLVHCNTRVTPPTAAAVDGDVKFAIHYDISAADKPNIAGTWFVFSNRLLQLSIVNQPLVHKNNNPLRMNQYFVKFQQIIASVQHQPMEWLIGNWALTAGMFAKFWPTHIVNCMCTLSFLNELIARMFNDVDLRLPSDPILGNPVLIKYIEGSNASSLTLFANLISIHNKVYAHRLIMRQVIANYEPIRRCYAPMDGDINPDPKQLMLWKKIQEEGLQKKKDVYDYELTKLKCEFNSPCYL